MVVEARRKLYLQTSGTLAGVHKNAGLCLIFLALNECVYREDRAEISPFLPSTYHKELYHVCEMAQSCLEECQIAN